MAISLSSIQAATRKALAYDPTAQARIDRASAIINLGHVERVSEREYRVTSQADRTVTYTVTPEDGCTCEDARRRPGQRCKHEWAARILVQAERFQEADAYPLLSTTERSALERIKTRREVRV